MSRIGKLPVTLPQGVTFTKNGNLVSFKGAKGELSLEIKDFITINQNENLLTVGIENMEDTFQKSVWGLTRTLLSNMVIGVSTGYQKSLEIIGVGYKFEVSGPNKLILSVGFSHKVELNTPSGVTVEADPQLKNTIIIKGIDKQQVGFFAAKVRSIKKPEPYKGKGIRYVGEYVRRKAGKTGGKK